MPQSRGKADADSQARALHIAVDVAHEKAQNRWRIAVAALLAVGLPVLWATVGASVVPHFERMLRELGTWGELGFVAGGALAVAVCAPASLLYITGGMVFGVAEGTLLGAAAGAIGSALAFMIARSALGKRVAQTLSRRTRLDRFERALSERPLRILLLLRLSLLFPIGPVSYALGLSRIKVSQFLATSPALLPAVLTYAYAGSLARDVFGAQQHAREPWEWALLGVGLLATIGAAWLVGRAATRALSRHSAPPRASGVPRASRTSLTAEQLLPPRVHDASGKPRTVGVEIEFGGLDLNGAARTVVELFGGRIVHDNECEVRVVESRLGEFHVEIDSRPLKLIAKKKRRGLMLDWVERFRRQFLGSVVGSITPYEISTAPLPIERIGELDRLAHALGRAGAEGTSEAIWSAVGVHFNPSLPSTEPQVILDYIRAYSLLHPELVDALDVNPTRRVLRFATAYPDAYVRKILDPDYAPDMTQLIDDYLEHNATRNRGLDCLPLFAYFDADRVRTATKDPRIWGRPTFHFRLPNSKVDDPAWRVSDEWRLWLEVERLAADPARLARLSAQALRQLDKPLPIFRTRWQALGGSATGSR
ncbi:MAG TPA: amidoligase family protein [Polyangiales bacterium]|nr:amidoligase family protein [Polyangiales bacterium]